MTTLLAVAVHPFTFVAVTVYVVVAVGATVSFVVVIPLLHAYDTPPAAVSTTLPPEQSAVAAGVIEGVGSALTVTVTAVRVADTQPDPVMASA